MPGGTDVGFAEACANAHSGVRVVMCQTAAGSKRSNATVGSAAQTRRMESTHTAPEVCTGPQRGQKYTKMCRFHSVLPIFKVSPTTQNDA